MSLFRLRSGESWRSPWASYAALREADPVHEADGFWVLSRFADVYAAARDTATYSSAGGLTVTDGAAELDLVSGFAPMVMLDPPDHTAFRRLVSRGFTPKQVTELEPQVRAFVRARLDVVRATGETDIVADLLKPLPSMVVAHYLGVPLEDRVRFDAWTDAIVAATSAGHALSAADAAAEMFDYFTHLVERRRSDPGDDTVSQLALAGEGGGDDVDVLRMLGFAFTMVAGGNDTTTGLLGVALELLTAHPGQRRLLADEPTRIPDAVEELLRLASPVQGLARTTTRAVELHGRVLPAGARVLLLYAAANRDPREFGVDADDLDVTRGPRRILTFGHGAHHCLGAAAARLAARVVLEELLATCPDFAVDASSGTFAEGHYVRRFATLPFTAERVPVPVSSPRR